MTTDLIKKLEALTGPDREADAKIWCIVHNFTFKKKTEHLTSSNGIFYAFRTREKGDVGISCVPNYTSSVDAAIALAERIIPNCYWSVEAGCSIIRDDSYDYSSQHPAPAIALCIAILKAKEASK